MRPAAWLAEFSRQYYVPLEEYDRDGDGLLVSSGAGIMLATMDVCQRFRWCVDVDRIKDGGRFGRWLRWAENFVGVVGVVGWFSLTDPAPLRQAISGLKQRPVCYTPFTDLGGRHCRDLDEFIRHIE